MVVRSEKAEHERAGNRERDGAEQHDQRITKALKLGRQHEIDQDDCEARA